MSKDGHNEDEYFRKAYRQAEEQPSPEVWEKINAGLDNADAVYFRNKFVVWKRIACILLLLLSSLVIYHIFSIGDNTVTKIVASHAPGKIDSNTTSIEKNINDSSVTFQEGKLFDSVKNARQSYNNNIRQYSYTQQHRITINKLQPPEQRLIASDSGRFLNREEKSNVDEPSLLFNRPSKNAEVNTKDSSNSSYNTAEVLNNKQDDSSHQLLIANNTANKEELATSKQLSKSKNSKNFKPYFTITPYASVDFTQYELDDDDHNPNNTGDDKQDIEGRETHQVSYSAGVLGKWQFSPKLSLKTGLVYSNIIIAIHPQTLYASAEDNQKIGYKFITSSGYAFVNPVFSSSPVVGDSINATFAHHHLQYLNVPLMAGYKINAGKHFSVMPGIGLNASILLSTIVRTEVNEDTNTEMVVINKLQGLQKTYYSISADAEFNYMLNKHISITALPMFKYALNSITKNNVVRAYPYSIGLGAGITYRF